MITPTTNEVSGEMAWPRFPRSDDSTVGVDQETYDDLVRYTKYASGAYQLLCPRPMGNTLVAQFQDIVTSTKGFIARDDNREELVVAFKGTTDLTSILLDASIVLLPMRGPGLPPPDPSADATDSEPRVHVGFLLAYDSIAQTVLHALEPQLRLYPSYTIVACGHSLGVNRFMASLDPSSTFESLPQQGSIASLASVAFSHSFPGRSISLYTFGQPRTGNGRFAELVECIIGTKNIFRCVHAVDGVPTMILTQLGYRHFGAEYWQFAEFGGTTVINNPLFRCAKEREAFRGRRRPEWKRQYPIYWRESRTLDLLSTTHRLGPNSLHLTTLFREKFDENGGPAGAVTHVVECAKLCAE